MPPMPPMGPGRGGPGGRHADLLKREKPKNVRRTLGRLLRYIGRSRYLFFALLAVMLSITALGLAAPKIQQIAIDCITPSEERTGVDTEKLITTLIVLGIVYAVSAVMTYLQGRFSFLILH